MALSVGAKLPTIFKINYLTKISSTSAVPRVYIRTFTTNLKSAPFLNSKCTPTFRRTFFQFFRKPSAEKLKVIDGIPEHYKLIYRNGMHRYLFSAQIVSFMTAAIVVVMAITYTSWEIDPTHQPWGAAKDSTPIENEVMIYVGCFVTLWVILQVILGKMPIRIYNLPQKEKYVFVFYGSLPLTKRRLVCKVKDVVKLEETGLLPWKDSRYEIRNKQGVIMLENCFRRPADLNIMLGYQKPPEDYD